MEKTFKTHLEQIEILKAKGLCIPNVNEALKILNRENYYNLINGYKQLFLDSHSPECFKKDATFSELHSLFSFDRHLRNTLIGYFLLFETNIKSRFSYRFCEANSEVDAYLMLKNYNLQHASAHLLPKLLANFSKITHKHKYEKRNSNLKHYLTSNSHAPLWIFVNFMTFGQIKLMFTHAQSSLKNKVAQDFSHEYENSYQQKIFISSDMLDSILHATNFFRNVCAHEERLYNYKLALVPKTAKITKILNLEPDLVSKGNLFTVVALLKLVVPRNDYQSLKNLLFSLFFHYESHFHSTTFDHILQSMGFPEDWYQLI